MPRPRPPHRALQRQACKAIELGVDEFRNSSVESSFSTLSLACHQAWCTRGWVSSQCKHNVFQYPRLATRTAAALVIAVLPELDSYTDGIALGVPFQTRRPSKQRRARETGRKSETDCRIRRADAERQLHAMLHGFPCLPRARAASPIARPCCPMTEPNCHCPDRHHLDDRLVHSHISSALTSSSSPSRQVSTCRTRINVCAWLIDVDPCWQRP